MLDEPYRGGGRSDDLGGVFDGKSERYSQDEDFPLLGWKARELSHQSGAIGVDELLAGRPFAHVNRVGVFGRGVPLGVRHSTGGHAVDVAPEGRATAQVAR